MKKVKHLLVTVGAVLLLIELSSCDFITHNNHYNKKDKEGVASHFETKTDSQLLKEAETFLKTNFPEDKFTDGKFESNTETEKIITFDSEKLKQKVSVRNRWVYGEESLEGKNGRYEYFRDYSWNVNTNYIALMWHPFEEAYESITKVWFPQSKVFFDYSNCFHEIPKDFQSDFPLEFLEYWAKSHDDYYGVESFKFDIWGYTKVVIAVKYDAENESDYEYTTDAFMYYLSKNFDDEKYCPSGYYYDLNGELYYLKNEVNLDNITVSSLQNEKWFKQNGNKLVKFDYAGGFYDD